MGSSWSTAAPTAVDAHEQPRCRCTLCARCCEGSSSSGSSNERDRTNSGVAVAATHAATQHQDDNNAMAVPFDLQRNESVVSLYSPTYRHGAAAEGTTTNPLRPLGAGVPVAGVVEVVASSSSEGHNSSELQHSGSNHFAESLVSRLAQPAFADSLDAAGSLPGARRATATSGSLGSSLSDERRRSSVTRTPSTRSMSHTQTPREAVSLQGVDISSKTTSATHQPLVHLVKGSSGETVSLCSPQLPTAPSAVLWLEGDGDVAAATARPARPRRHDLLLVDVFQADTHGESIATSRRRSSHISPLLPTPRLGPTVGSATHQSELPEYIDEAAKGGRSHWTVRRLQTSFSSLGSVASHVLDGSCASTDLSGRQQPAIREEVRSARAQPMTELVLERGLIAGSGTPSVKCYDSLTTTMNLDEFDVRSPEVAAGSQVRQQQQTNSNRAPDVNQPLDLPWSEVRLVEDENCVTIHRPRVVVTSPALRSKSISEADAVLSAVCEELP